MNSAFCQPPSLSVCWYQGPQGDFPIVDSRSGYRKSPQKSPGAAGRWQVVQIKPESTGRGGSKLRGGPYFWERGGYCFGTATQSAQVRIPRPYRPLRKSRQKSPGGLKWQVLQKKPESTGRGSIYGGGR